MGNYQCPFHTLRLTKKVFYRVTSLSTSLGRSHSCHLIQVVFSRVISPSTGLGKCHSSHLIQVVGFYRVTSLGTFMDR